MRGTGNKVRLAAGLAGTVDLAGRRDRGVVDHRNRHLRRESPRPSSPSPWTPTRCAPRSTRSPCRARCWSSATATRWGTSWCVSRRGCRPARPIPAPKTPVVLDQNGCQYMPHVHGHHGRPDRTRSSIPTASCTTSTRCPRSTRLQQADAADAQGGDDLVRQAGAGLPDQVRRPPLDDRLHRRLQPPVLRGHRHRRQVHDLRSDPGTYEITAWHERLGTQTATVTVGGQRHEDPELQVRHPAAK